ncbi:uncharacterized protein B0H18DRAFT_1118705 [Fomitopsis serialis]|uniref:uncharacterized protein n=1 Tax=Fomitopsis serialis TaxID=139415 RepID=UPI00200897D0|nr:uncharacterized protein B0H18DRAFT_1118705 [Neoantrodia serialis]KAH9926957.1 hypothetical protein B0H18DRAFT_1118705 [Neoantrodia serialis]
MVSVPSPSYLPPLAFEPFALSEPHSLTLTAPPTPPPTTSTHPPPPTAYSHHPSTRIRGPRVRPQLRLVNGRNPQAPARGSASDADVDAPGGSLRLAFGRESTSARTSRNAILAKTRPPQAYEGLERFASDAGARMVRRPAVRPGTAPDLGPARSRHGESWSANAGRDVGRAAPATPLGAGSAAGGPQASHRILMATDPRLAAVQFEIQKPQTAPPAMEDPGLDGGAAGIDLSHDDPFKFKVTGDDLPYPSPSHLTPPVAYDDQNQMSRPDSLASSRPASALPGATIDALEDLAAGLRHMNPHNPPQEVVARSRRPIGPRPRSPPSAASSHFPRSGLGSAYSSTEMLDIVDEAGLSENGGVRPSSPRPIREDVEWVADYGLWCSSSKGKWKVPWVENDADETVSAPEPAVLLLRSLSLPSFPFLNQHASHAAQATEADSEPYFTYDPQNAPEFLVGKSSSLTVTAAPGFHSRRLPRLRTARRQHGRNNRPPGLVLASGSQPDPPTPDDSNPPPPSHRAPPHSAPATHSHFNTKPHKQPDLRGLELLIGPLEPRSKPPPKPKTLYHRRR